MKNSWKTSFAIIYAGQAFSILGSAAVQFAVIWWLTERTQSALTLTYASIVSFLPAIFVGPFAGVFIDRYNRKIVMVLADGFVALSSVALGVAFLLSPNPPLSFIYLILFLRGLGSTFHGPAMQAAIPMLVPTAYLTKAGGWGNMVSSFSNMIGPVLGAVLMGFLPLASIMLVDILGAMFAIVSLLFVTIPNIPQTGEGIHILSDMKQGFAALRSNKPLMAIALPVILVNLLFVPSGSLFPLLVFQHYMGQAWHNSIVEFVFAAGLLASSAIIGMWGGMKKRFIMVSIAIAVLGITSVLSGALPAQGFWIFVAACFFMGGTASFYNVPIMAYTQETTPPEVMGKVFSLIMTVLSLALPFGLLIAGPVSEAIGVDQWFLWSGAALVGVAMVFRLCSKRYDKETMLPEKTQEAAK